MKDFYDSWFFLRSNPIYELGEKRDSYHWDFLRNLYIEVVKVNPETNSIDDDKTKNTKTMVWLEYGPDGCHDIRLDCGGDTFEEAIIKLANLVNEHYENGYPKIDD